MRPLGMASILFRERLSSNVHPSSLGSLGEAWPHLAASHARAPLCKHELGEAELEHDAAVGIPDHVHLVHDAAAELRKAPLQDESVDRGVRLLNRADGHVLALLCDRLRRLCARVALDLQGQGAAQGRRRAPRVREAGQEPFPQPLEFPDANVTLRPTL